MRIILIIFLFSISSFSISQSAKSDSLFNLIKSESSDSLRQVDRLLYIISVRHAWDLSKPILDEGIAQAKAAHDFYFLGQFFYNAGIMQAYIGENERSLQNFEISLNYRIFIADTSGIAASSLGLSNIYKNLGDYQNAINYGLKAEQAFNHAKDSSGLAKTYNALGLIFKHQKDFQKSLTYYRKGFKIAALSSDEFIIAGLLDNIGAVYQGMFQFDSALVYHKQALARRLIARDPKSLGISYGNIGLVFKNKEEPDSASYYFNLALENFKLVGFTEGLALSYTSIAGLYHDQKKYQKSIENYKSAESYALKGNFLPELIDISSGIAKSYEKIGNFKEATFYLNQYILLRDSLFNTEKSNEVQRQAFEFQYAQKLLADSLKQAEEEKIKTLENEKQNQIDEEKLAKQKLYTYAGVGGVGLCLIIAFILFRNNKKQKVFTQVIAEQKATVEEKNKEITDSINYAKRIQDAILPPLKLIELAFPNSFVLYQPKDIVAGDFYWFEKRNDLAFIAAADCTGHGVPGAMVSVVCSNALNRAVKEFNLIDSSKILTKVRELVIETFEKSEEDVKDGMDISLCVFDLKKSTLKWSGANNALWIIDSKQELKAFHPNRQPIGNYAHATDFDTHDIKLELGDQIYLFTDGLVDQFGGDKGKKFKATNLQKLLISLSHKTMQEQKKSIELAFNKWKGELEQVDDVCIIGIRV